MQPAWAAAIIRPMEREAPARRTEMRRLVAGRVAAAGLEDLDSGSE